MDEITILDKTYISSKRAAEITGYAKDYVGQLCREGHIDAKMVGRSWYVYEPSIRKHRFGEDESSTLSRESGTIRSEDDVSEASAASLVPQWEPSVYEAESVDMIPPLQTPIRAPFESGTIISVPKTMSEMTPEDTHATLTDMQLAWREWFDRKQEARIESPEIIEARIEAPEVAEEVDEETLAEDPGEESEEEFSIPIHKMQSEEAVPINLIDSIESVAEPAFIYPDEVAEEMPKEIVRTKPVTKRGSRIMKRDRATKERARSNVLIMAFLFAIAMISIAVATVGTGYAEKYLSGHGVHNPIVNFLVGDSTFRR